MPPKQVITKQVITTPNTDLPQKEESRPAVTQSVQMNAFHKLLEAKEKASLPTAHQDAPKIDARENPRPGLSDARAPVAENGSNHAQPPSPSAPRAPNPQQEHQPKPLPKPQQEASAALPVQQQSVSKAPPPAPIPEKPLGAPLKEAAKQNAPPTTAAETTRAVPTVTAPKAPVPKAPAPESSAPKTPAPKATAPEPPAPSSPANAPAALSPLIKAAPAPQPAPQSSAVRGDAVEPTPVQQPPAQSPAAKSPAAKSPPAQNPPAQSIAAAPTMREPTPTAPTSAPHPIVTSSEPAAPIAPTAEDRPTPRLVSQSVGLEVRSLGKQFKKRPVLRDVSLRLQRGEAVGLLGPNGAGKTTCFYIVTGLIAPDYGEIILDNNDITSLPMYRRARLGIGYLPQEASIFRGLTVEQNIMAVLELIEKNRDKRHESLDALMNEFGISHLRRTPAVALSGGERRRLEIARALASQPHFILLDEPLAGIDPIAVREIRELVSHLKDRSIGVLITDHNVRETLDIVDRAYILHDGSVLMEGTPDAIVDDQEVRRVYLGERFQLY